MDIEKIISAISRYWFAWQGLVIAEFVLIAGFITAYDPIGDLILNPIIRWLTWLLIAQIIALFWVSSRNYFPKNRSDVVGILFAITTETEGQRRMIDNELYAQLKEQLVITGKVTKSASMVLLKNNYKAEKAGKIFADNAEAMTEKSRLIRANPKLKYKPTKAEIKAQKFVKQTDCHFFIWGKVRESMSRGKPIYSLSLRWHVRHRPISIDASEVLSLDLSQSLPVEIIFDKENEFENTQLSVGAIYFASKYIVAVSAIISGFIEYGIERLKELKVEMRSALAMPGINYIKNKIPEWLTTAYSTRARAFDTIGDSTQAEADCLKALEQNPKDYSSLLILAKTQFELGKKSESWKTILRARAQSPDEFSSMYSVAFLEIIFDEFKTALKSYEKAIKNTPDSPNAKRVVEGILDHTKKTLLREPQYIQLYFVLGMIHLSRSEYVGAIENYEQFIRLASANEGKYSLLLARGRGDLAEIQKMIGY